MKIKKILFILVLFLVFGEAFALINMSKECACAASADGKLRTAKGFVVEEIDGVTYIDGYLVVNKTYKLPQTYKPSNTHVEVGNQQSCKTCIIDE
ncbi:MAG: hypothetical protein IKW51_07860, partial [Bacteroidales bacterium]|nr:hypothetical protein [Bacteroidales bacterium]